MPLFPPKSAATLKVEKRAWIAVVIPTTTSTGVDTKLTSHEIPEDAKFRFLWCHIQEQMKGTNRFIPIMKFQIKILTENSLA